MIPCVRIVAKAIFGSAETTKGAYDEASKNLKLHVKTLNTSLEGKSWLVGNSVTLADVVVLMALKVPLQTVLDGGYRKGQCKNVEPWALAYYKNEKVIKHEGKVQFCAKSIKPQLMEEKKPEKKEAPKPVVKKEKEEKPKENIELLPATDFVIYDYKTFLINHPDKAGVGIDDTYKKLDWNGWSYWFFEYEKFGKEG